MKRGIRSSVVAAALTLARAGAATELPPGPERVQARLESNLADELRLEAFDINGAGKPSLLGDLEGTTMMLRIDDPAGKPIGVFKPSSGSTYHRAELAAYRLAKRLRLPVYPATVHKTLDRGGVEAFRRLLEAREFPVGVDDPPTGHFRQKERNRLAMLDRLRSADRLDGVLKAWISPLIFYYELGTIETIRRHPLYEHLRWGGTAPSEDWLDLVQCTKHFEPKGCFEAKLSRRDLAEQFTGILLIDALLGNRDRFAGGNLHLRSRTGRLMELGEDRYALPYPELLSLDNGASLLADSAFALRVLAEDLKIARFSRAHREALESLAEELRADPEGVREALGLEPSYSRGDESYEPMKIIASNLSAVLTYFRRLDVEIGSEAFF